MPNRKGSPDVGEQVVVDILGHALLEVIHRIGGVVADGEVGVLVGVLEVVASILIVHADDGRHEQGIDKAVGDACREGRRVKHLRLGGGQSALL